MERKYAMKTILFSLLLMGSLSMILLVILAACTYVCKWQAPQVRIGITFVYILSGLLGGSFQAKRDGSLEIRERIVRGGMLGTVYMCVLLVLSLIFTNASKWDYGHLFAICILVICSSVLGGFTSNIFSKKP